ncbi:MAG: NlpC/P60 family protein [Clostridiales bacterium]|nr:NlpC/P60 family protein [Clostridiales bacterium]
MKRRVPLTAFLCITAGLLFQNVQVSPVFVAEAETVSELEGETDSDSATEEELTEDSESESETEIGEKLETEVETDTETADEMGTEAESETEEEDSVVGELIFAQCEGYINIRDEASTDGEITAKIYNNGSATVLSVEEDVDGDWYEITSGNAHGYAKAEYFATGEEAAAIAEEIAYNVATVRVAFLNIRAEATKYSELVDVAKENDELEVVLYGEDWMKVALGNDVYGYIKADYVDYATYYPVAETIEEETARLIAEGLLSVEDAKAAIQSENNDAAETEQTEETQEAQTEASQPETIAQTEETQTETVAQTEALTQAETVAQTEALQSETVAQTEETQTETVAQTEAPQAETVAQTEAPQTETAVQTEAPQSETTAQTEAPQTETAVQTEAPQTDTAAQTEAPQTETVAQTEAPQTETVAQTEAPQTETAAQTEAPQTETTVQTEAETEAASSSSSSASTGESIAAYALQFVGYPYVYGGTSLTEGADCSGFVQSVFSYFGIYLSRTAAAQATNGTTVSLSELQAGDLLFYSSTGDGSIDHVAIYIGSGCIVHAANSTRGICTDSAYYATPVCAVRCY